MPQKFDKEAIKQWFIRLLVKFRRIKTVSLSAEELNSMLDVNLPESFTFPVPGSKGTLTINQALLSMPPGAHHFELELACSINIVSLANPIYRANIVINITALPDFDITTKVIQLQEIKILGITLVQDQYALLQDTKYLINQLMPGPIKTVLGVTGITVKSTLNILSNGTYDDVKGYFSLYLDGSKQKVLDFHKPELEKIILRLDHNGDLQYRMDESIFEERLFAELGKEVRVEDGKLHFVFH